MSSPHTIILSSVDALTVALAHMHCLMINRSLQMVMHSRDTMMCLRSVLMCLILGWMTWTHTQGKMTQMCIQGRMTLLGCRLLRTPRDITETRMCHPMSPRRKKFEGS
ncbi:hypothetical protein BDR07DRAFT_1435081 [Suillus spraguei]|nr:hypothetical protein BDR07DRAFT_1435081 [Suillus spraguei]